MSRYLGESEEHLLTFDRRDWSFMFAHRDTWKNLSEGFGWEVPVCCPRFAVDWHGREGGDCQGPQGFLLLQCLAAGCFIRGRNQKRSTNGLWSAVTRVLRFKLISTNMTEISLAFSPSRRSTAFFLAKVQWIVT